MRGCSPVVGWLVVGVADLTRIHHAKLRIQCTQTRYTALLGGHMGSEREHGGTAANGDDDDDD